MRDLAPWLALLVGCADPRPDWAPAPPETVARCVYRDEAPEDAYFGRSALYFDARGRVIQADGIALIDGLVRTSSRFAYDEQDRLVHEWNVLGEVTYTYDATGALEVWQFDDGARREIRHAIDAEGRVTRSDGPLDLPDYTPLVHEIDYDALGRVTRELRSEHTAGGTTGTYELRYTYDAEGRLASSTRGTNVATYVYTTVGNQLGIVEDTNGNRRDWTLQFDAELRLQRINSSTAPPFVALEYVYGDNEFRESGKRQIIAVGDCPQPRALLAPPEQRLAWRASLVAPVFPQFLFGQTFRF